MDPATFTTNKMHHKRVCDLVFWRGARRARSSSSTTQHEATYSNNAFSSSCSGRLWANFDFDFILVFPRRPKGPGGDTVQQPIILLVLPYCFFAQKFLHLDIQSGRGRRHRGFEQSSLIPPNTVELVAFPFRPPPTSSRMGDDDEWEEDVLVRQTKKPASCAPICCVWLHSVLGPYFPIYSTYAVSFDRRMIFELAK